MMATLLVGVLLLVALYFALRHVVRNLREGKEDCCGGCPGCHGGCSGCHPLQYHSGGTPSICSLKEYMA